LYAKVLDWSSKYDPDFKEILEKDPEAIAFLLNHPVIAADYGKNAYGDVYRQFNIEQTVAKLMTIWG
jgi:hypothetical protein